MSDKGISRSTEYRKRKAEAELAESTDSDDSSTRIEQSDGESSSDLDKSSNIVRRSTDSPVQNAPEGVDDINEVHPVGGYNDDVIDRSPGSIGREGDELLPNAGEDSEDESENDLSEASLESDSDSDSADEDFVPMPGEGPLYDGCPISMSQSLIALLTFSCVHNVPGTCLADLLKLISLHLPSTPDVFKSLYRFKKYFGTLKTPLQYHHYCSMCFTDLPTEDAVCGNCPEGTKKTYFISMSIVEQVKNLYKRRGFASLLNSHSRKEKHNKANYEDIYDGNIYKMYVEKGFLGGSNISLTWNSDGVSIFRSSKYEVWPFYLVINELPYSERFKEENLLLAGLWFGGKKPKSNLFMSKMKSEFEMLFNGIDIYTPDNVALTKIQGLVICGTCDLPAKAIFLNMKQFNAYHSFCKCLIKGERSERTHNSLAFPVDNSPLRNEKDIKNCAKNAVEEGEAVLGIKGPTMLSKIMPHCYRSMAIDVMHCVYQGIAKRQMQLWFEPEFREERFSLRRAVNIVSDFIAAITPPSYFQRLPRSIVEHLSYWKASEFKAWLLYFSIPILKEIMSPEYFQHHMLLVCAIWLLNQNSISENDVDNAESLIREYLLQFQILYGYKFVTMNFHLLLHLPNCVREFGPLWTVSTFRFEILMEL